MIIYLHILVDVKCKQCAMKCKNNMQESKKTKSSKIVYLVSMYTLSTKYKQRSDLATGLCLFTMVLNFY